MLALLIDAYGGIALYDLNLLAARCSSFKFP